MATSIWDLELKEDNKSCVVVISCVSQLLPDRKPCWRFVRILWSSTWSRMCLQTDNYDCYVEYLGKISAILEECTTTKIAIVGDFNAAVSTSFETELLALCESQNFVVSDYQLLGRLSEQFTFVSDAHSTTSWLDHFICSHDLHQRITSLYILDKSPCSDHLPIHAVFNLDVIGTIDSCEGSESKNCSTVPAIN